MTDPINLGVKRAEATNDNRRYSPKDMLEQCIKEVDEGGNKSAIGIMVEHGPDGDVIDVSYRASNLSHMEIVAICERVKFLVMT